MFERNNCGHSTVEGGEDLGKSNFIVIEFNALKTKINNDIEALVCLKDRALENDNEIVVEEIEIFMNSLCGKGVME